MPSAAEQPSEKHPDSPKSWWILAALSILAMVPCVAVSMVPILGLLAMPAVPLLIVCCVFFLQKAGVASDYGIVPRSLALTATLIAVTVAIFSVALDAHWTVLRLSRGVAAPPLLASAFSVWRLLLPAPAALLVGSGIEPRLQVTLAVYCCLLLLLPMTAWTIFLVGQVLPLTA